MSELFDHIDKLKKTEPRVAVATLVNTRGTTPRKEGAKMVVGEGGRVLGSVTIGGCVDAQVIEQSADVLDQNVPRLLELDLGDEEAWEIGLTCGGTIEVFLEPVSLDKPGDETLVFSEKARAHAEAGGRAVVMTRLDGDGHGAKLLLTDDGATEGSLGDPFLDRRFAAEAQEAMRAGKSRTLFLEGVRVFAEVSAPPTILAMVGASHVAMPLVTMARGPRLPDHRDRRPAALRDPRAVPRRGRPSNRHPVRAGPGGPAHRHDRAGPGGARLQVRRPRAAPRPRHSGRIHRAARQQPAGSGHSQSPARGRRGRRTP
jgi:xanthine/CO dehydrogenase XdhC/CoxF family maturation factor